MNMRWLALVVGVPLALGVAACGDDDDDDPTPTRTQDVTEAATTVAAPPTSPATTTATQPPTDGTVAPENPGSTDPVTTKPVPDPLTTVPLLQDVRMGVHPENGGWERIVFEFDSGLPPAEVQYVQSVSQCGSGNAVALEGAAVLSVTFQGAAQHTDAGQPTFDEQALPGPGNTILEAKQTCDFEAELGWAMGVKGEQNFKVTMLQGPPRLVIDVKQ
jgi:hypothetical protein